MTETKLKPCPFCGREVKIAKGKISFWVYCPHCVGQTELYETEQKAIEAWNARPIEHAQAAEIKRLREALELIAKEKFYFAHGEEEKQIRRVCEIAKEALKGKEE